LVAKEDQPVVTFLASMPNHKPVILDDVPTVENLARQAFQILEPIFKNAFKGRLTLAAIRLYETPNCWADVFSADAVTV
jgi:6-pyruvoyltetrahydropterin/6-carboxytetrahydropterin synthase